MALPPAGLRNQLGPPGQQVQAARLGSLHVLSRTPSWVLTPDWDRLGKSVHLLSSQA